MRGKLRGNEKAGIPQCEHHVHLLVMHFVRVGTLPLEHFPPQRDGARVCRIAVAQQFQRGEGVATVVGDLVFGVGADVGDSVAVSERDLAEQVPPSAGNPELGFLFCDLPKMPQGAPVTMKNL
jgi:hypothetical protein